MSFDTLIVEGTVATASDTFAADVAIEGGKIVALGANLPRQNAKQVLDASGRLVLPGGIDVHTHLDMPFGGTTSADDFETGTRAAAFGGTTTLIDFAIQYKGQSLRTAFDAWMAKAQPKATKPAKVKAARLKPATKAPKERKESKQALFIEAMRTAKGISITEAAEPFGWQAHMVRGAVAAPSRRSSGSRSRPSAMRSAARSTASSSGISNRSPASAS